MKIQSVSVDQKRSGVPIVGRGLLFGALDLYVANPSPAYRRFSPPPATSSRIIRISEDDFSGIPSKEVFLHRLKEAIEQELAKHKRSSHNFSDNVIKPFTDMRLTVTALEDSYYVLELVRFLDESFEERLALMHEVERGLDSVTIKIPFIREGDEIRIDFEELMRLFDSVPDLNTGDIKGDAFLKEITSSGVKKNQFSLDSHDFKVDDLRVTMRFSSIANGYDLAANIKAGVCVIDGPVLIAPLENNDAPNINIRIVGKLPGSDYLQVPIVDEGLKVKAITMADQIKLAFQPIVPKSESTQSKRPWWKFNLASLSSRSTVAS